MSRPLSAKPNMRIKNGRRAKAGTGRLASNAGSASILADRLYCTDSPTTRPATAPRIKPPTPRNSVTSEWKNKSVPISHPAVRTACGLGTMSDETAPRRAVSHHKRSTATNHAKRAATGNGRALFTMGLVERIIDPSPMRGRPRFLWGPKQRSNDGRFTFDNSAQRLNLVVFNDSHRHVAGDHNDTIGNCHRLRNILCD